MFHLIASLLTITLIVAVLYYITYGVEHLIVYLKKKSHVVNFDNVQFHYQFSSLGKKLYE